MRDDSNFQMSFQRNVSEDKIFALVKMVFYYHFIDFMCSSSSNIGNSNNSFLARLKPMKHINLLEHVTDELRNTLHRYMYIYSQRPVSQFVNCGFAGFCVCFFFVFVSCRVHEYTSVETKPICIYYILFLKIKYNACKCFISPIV